MTPAPGLRSCLVALLALIVVGVACDEATPPTPAPQSLAPTMGSSLGGDHVAIIGEGFVEGSTVLFGGAPARDVRVIRGVMTAVTPPHAAGEVVVTVHDPVGRTVEVPTRFQYLQASEDGRPRVVGAASTGNTGLRIFFSEAVQPGAEDTGNYLVVQPNVNSESAALLILDGVLAEDGLSVDLTTASQNEVSYEVFVTNVRDLEGNPLAAPELMVDPSKAQFAGTPPSADGTLVDTDGDGLPDNVEQIGWVVTIQLSNGDVFQSTRTSDFTLADTDGDGLTDERELAFGTNPRLVDSDGDTLGDLVEIDLWHSSATAQDTDGDGLADATDVKYQTAPILADTDGDGMDDRDELFLFNRNPLLADLPQPQIVVGEYSLLVNVTSSFTDENGTTQAVQSSMSSTVSQSLATSVGQSDTRSTEASNSSSQSFGGEVGYSTKDGWSGKATFSAGFEQASARGFSSTVDTQTSRESQQSFEKSASQAMESSQMRSVSRTIDSAQVQATVNVANAGSVPFTLRNLELSLQRQDRSIGGAFRPVATLRPASGTDLAINMGPFDSQRGPIIFENTTVFPNVVEELIREPAGLVFKVANFDVLDAQGNNFAFSSATVSSRTAGLTIDFGDGRVESYRIATHNQFGPDGLPQGISVERALELIGMSLVHDDAALPEPLPAVLEDAIRNSVGVLTDDSGVERLVRVRGMQNDLRGLPSAEKRFWTVRTNNTAVAPDSDFSDLRLRAGQEYLLLYTRDLDEDGLFEMEELFYGSSDSAADTDGDGLPDLEEVRTGWTVSVSPGTPRRVFSSPARDDSDLDGLLDAEERAHGTDPNQADTDGDGLNDRIELFETLAYAMADGDADDLNNVLLEVTPYTDASIWAASEGTVLLAALGDDVQHLQVGETATAGALVIGPGANGLIDTPVPGTGVEVFRVPSSIAPGVDGVCNTTATGSDLQRTGVGESPVAGEVCIRPGAPDFVLQTRPQGDDYLRVAHDALYTVSPTRPDTDFDGLPDGRETRVGTHPNTRDAGKVLDSDQDGLRDSEEDAGWLVCVGTSACELVTANKFAADTDLDGLPDVYEFVLGSHPRKRDTDGDGLSDVEEFDVTDPSGFYDASALETANRRCADASACQLASLTPTSTHVVSPDSDGDGRTDRAEVKVSWVVTTGGISNTVFSDPNKSDEDGEGLDDSEELTAGTNPRNADTDDDRTSDKAELDQAIGRNPLVKDRRIQLNNLLLHVDGDCDEGGSGGEFEGGDILLAIDGAAPARLMSFSECHGDDEGTDCNTAWNRAPFVITSSFTLSANPLEDDDDNADDVLRVFDPVSFDVNTTTQSVTLYATENDSSCQLRFTFSLVAD